ncbi:DUF6174 domain-containing protein [Longimicrobium sp.]|uniref:DUF6174 domain-containing protein n=1 Tax=Longimicrobium sp. TaxID=2029185 RepID=UPI002F940218
MNLLRRTAAALASVVALSACAGNSTLADEEARMERSRQVWNAQGIDDYRMIVSVSAGMIAGSATIEVRDGVPVSVQRTEGGPQTLPLSAFARYDTVEELFAVLEQAFENGSDEIEALYDSTLGVPLSVAIDPMKNAIDEEHGFLVNGFTKL